MDDLSGWETSYAASEGDVKKKEDVAAHLVHFLLIKSGFKLIGLGESREFTGSEAILKTLPSGWNDKSSCSIRYIGPNGLYLLKTVHWDEFIAFDFINMKTHEISCVAFNCGKDVKSLKGPLESLFEDHEKVVALIKKFLILRHLEAKATTPPKPPPELNGGIYTYARVDPFWYDPDRAFADPPPLERRYLEPVSQEANRLEDRNRGIVVPSGLLRRDRSKHAPARPQLPCHRPPHETEIDIDICI